MRNLCIHISDDSELQSSVIINEVDRPGEIVSDTGLLGWFMAHVCSKNNVTLSPFEDFASLPRHQRIRRLLPY